MLTGILVPTSGTVRTCGLDPMRQRRELARRDRRRVRPALASCGGTCRCASRSRILAAIHRLDRRRRRGRARTSWSSSWRWARLPRHPGAPAVARPADARRDRRRPAALARAADPRRADHRARRAVASSGCASSCVDERASAARRCCSPPTTWATSSGSATGSLVVDHGRLAYDGHAARAGRDRRRAAGARRRPGRARRRT